MLASLYSILKSIHIKLGTVSSLNFADQFHVCTGPCKIISSEAHYKQVICYRHNCKKGKDKSYPFRIWQRVKTPIVCIMGIEHPRE
jgi:hypothetical protein